MREKKKEITKFNVAIDGPVGSGKTTIGQLVAQKLGYQFLDSGLVYRHFAFFYQQNNSQQGKNENVLLLWQNWLAKNKERLVSDLEQDRLRLSSPAISELASQLSPRPELRKIILGFQRELTSEQGWVVVGRDITSEVLPTAKIKIFLTASLAERIRRRNRQYGVKSSPEEVKKELANRDERDQKRETSPLKKTADSWELDTTDLSPIESVEKILWYITQQVS